MCQLCGSQCHQVNLVTGSAWEILHHKYLCFLQSIWLQCGRSMTSRIPKMLRFVLSILFLSLVWSLISWLDLNHQNLAVFSVKDIQKQVGSHDTSTNVYKMSSFSIHFWIFPVGYTNTEYNHNQSCAWVYKYNAPLGLPKYMLPWPQLNRWA